ncbi:response regulator [Actomonas aquatica]|uniref:Response regulator n=1 Tax=Actomonas aquatica TaxID=2866162 RepID=A0ABZ1C922_9BACT|nr:response regulator [Opitutus sp. WL0086]WRQ88197.1 response regulator [Opitutus sp. WL0086]
MKILIVEDDDISRDTLKQICETNESWEVTVAENGAIAWWLLSAPDGEAFDLMITDLDMPVGGGLDLIKRVRNNRSMSGMQTLVCSGNKDRDLVRELIRLGTNGYILKPYEARAVLDKVNALTASKTHRKIDIALGAGD